MKKYTIILLFLTQSLFSQDISVYFNQSVDNNACATTDAQRAINPEDTICMLLNTAVNTIEIAVWDNGSEKIVTALNNAYGRGVTVRYISSSNSLNTALGGLNAAIPVLYRQSLTETMHNKFIVIDHAVLLTGSMNFGEGSMFNDFNNFLIIHNSPLAANYVTEFDEMWGGSGAQPNATNSKFGADKTDNTIHSFNIGGTSVESYFSPSDGTTAKIVTALNTAQYTIDFCMFTFINNDLGDAVIAAKNRGVVVRGIIENVSYFGSEYNGLLSAGIDVRSHASIPYDLHHKYCVIDALYPTSDPLVVTGSHNWTNSAEDDYDENTLIIHNSEIAGQYFEEFTQRFHDLSSGILNPENTNSGDFVCPDVCMADGRIVVSTTGPDLIDIYFINSTGSNVFNTSLVSGTRYISEDLPAGIYIMNAICGKSSCVKKVVVTK